MTHRIPASDSGSRVPVAVRLLFLLLCPLVCSVSSAADDTIRLLPERSLPCRVLGTNAFVNDARFGSIRDQLSEVRSDLGMRHVRVLFLWSDRVQPGPKAARDFSFYDEIVKRIPKGADALIILTGLPSWMRNSGVWVGGDPRKTFVEQWVKPVMRRYAKSTRVVGFEIWNEPNDKGNEENQILGLAGHPGKYVSMVSMAYRAGRRINKKKLIVAAATTSINQGFPETVDYNRGMQEAGVEENAHVLAIHYYDVRLENVYRPGGVLDFLQEGKLPVWVTESGEQGVDDQADYAGRVWPFLLELSPRVKRIYQYQFAEGSAPDVTWGLRNPDPVRGYSDLYRVLAEQCGR